MQIKWWARKDLHKAGLLWGKLNGNMSNCTNSQQDDQENDEEITSRSYNKSQKFFFGQVTAGLGKNWSIDVTDLVNETNYDYNSVIFNLHLIAQNIANRDPTVWNQSVYNISIIIGNLMESLFPRDLVADNYTNVWGILKRTRELYGDVEKFSSLVDIVEQSFNLTAFIEDKIIVSRNRGFSSAGFLWEKMNQMLLKNNRSLSEEPDMQTRMLVSGKFPFKNNDFFLIYTFFCIYIHSYIHLFLQ